MNAVNALFREEQEAKAERALAAANGWVETARPLIALYLRLDDEDSALCRVPHQDEQEAVRQSVRRGREAIERARNDLYDEIGSIRDDAISAAVGKFPGGGTYEPQVVAYDELADAVWADAITVEQAISRVGREVLAA
jgi:hypothetical protein